MVASGCGGVILKDGKILLILRKNNNEYNGIWSNPGGKVEEGETVEEAVIREIREELGIGVKIVRKLSDYYDYKNNEIYGIYPGYEVRIVYGEPEIKEPNKIGEIRYFSLDELPINIAAWTKQFVDDLTKTKMPLDKSKLGLVQVFWGNGKGKTTSSLGTALRACGNGFRVHLVQFMKNGANSLEQQIPGEIIALEKFPNFTYKRFGIGGWVIKKPSEEQIAECRKSLEHVRESLKDESIDILIADEILYAVQLGLLTEEEIVELIEQKPKNKELILTGSHKPLKKVFEKADLISEIRKMKHPYDKGIMAREGIEF